MTKIKLLLRSLINPPAIERLFLVAIITILILIWFHRGLIIGSGESGLPFYNTSKLLESTESSWTDVPLGTSSAIGSASYTLYAIVTFFERLNVPPFVLQAGLYWFLLVTGVLAVHQIVLTIRGNSALIRLSSSLFYIFNPVVHVAVLHRVQYPLMFFYSFLPLAFMLYTQGLQKKSIAKLIYLNLIGVLFSFAFVGPSFIILLFVILGSFSLLTSIANIKDKVLSWYPIFYFLIFCLLFMLINAWWIVQFLSSVSVDLGSSGAVKYFSSDDNVSTFRSISEHLGSILSTFRLVPKEFYVWNGSSWGWIYSTPPFVVLSFFSMFAFIIGLLVKEKDFLFKFLATLALVVMFFSKGSLPPFGLVTLFLFKNVIFLQVLRNPFEKAGLLLPLLMAIPVGFGTAIIIQFLQKKLKISSHKFTVLFLMVVFPIYMFPIVNGYVFTGGGYPADDLNIGQYVKVPDYYKEAREWLNKQPDLFRVLVLPIDGEGMTYKWEYGFAGVELSNNLFDQSMISFSSSQSFLPEMVNSIKETLAKYPEKLLDLAKLFNVKYIMVRDDIDFLSRDTEDPVVDLSIIEKYLSRHFAPVAEFGKLKFFELKPSEFLPRVFASTDPIYIIFDPLRNALRLIPFSNPQVDNIFIVSSKSSAEDPYISLAKKIVVGGTRVENIKVNSKDSVENLPFVRIYRDTPFYALVRLKEELESQLQTSDSQLLFRVNLLGKRVAELNYSPQDASAIYDYIQLFQAVSKELVEASSLNLADRVISESLINQRQALDEIKKKIGNNDKIDQVISDLDMLLINIRAKSIYPTEKSIINRFNIPRSSKYEILISKDNWSNYFKDSGVLELDLDGKIIKLSPSKQISDKDTFSLGTYMLNQGIHEVSITQPKTINLIAEKLPEEFVVSSQDKQPITKAIPIADLDNSYTYSLSFEYLEEKGNVPVVALHSDVDLIDKKGEKIPGFGIALTRSNYDFGWKKYNGYFTPAPASHKYNISIKIIPFGDCKAIVQRPYRRYCQYDTFKQRFLLDSTTKFRNFKVEKIFDNPIILREVEDSSIRNISPEVRFEKVNAARYEVKVTNAQSPFFLVLSTTFDPRWNAYFMTSRPKNIIESLSESVDGDLVPSNNHLVVNGYANAWYIDKPGSYEMFLEYHPERAFRIGQKLSLVVIIISLLTIVVHKIYARHID